MAFRNTRTQASSQALLPVLLASLLLPAAHPPGAAAAAATPAPKAPAAAPPAAGGKPRAVTLAWTLGPAEGTANFLRLNLPCGSAVRFVWQSNDQMPHDIVQVARADCRASAIRTVGGPASSGDATVTYDRPGDYHYRIHKTHRTIGLP
ncbi:hypothetical protein GPECTOR_15g446 [Gonium pectorale]|uniref:Plastocyanin-like domain-containing protein n=1 Tax=Gonium pectorale TaxID=33097 RepID=A0A150GLU4_GONPE|nr:hypothetical protein GPECTOR_15g446 [Gonium pectorale]|eukprot:KXZ50761.1 hypothetical protein GPECTOR_15g446 [Gonium pectorale]